MLQAGKNVTSFYCVIQVGMAATSRDGTSVKISTTSSTEPKSDLTPSRTRHRRSRTVQVRPNGAFEASAFIRQIGRPVGLRFERGRVGRRSVGVRATDRGGQVELPSGERGRSQRREHRNHFQNLPTRDHEGCEGSVRPFPPAARRFSDLPFLSRISQAKSSRSMPAISRWRF